MLSGQKTFRDKVIALYEADVDRCYMELLLKHGRASKEDIDRVNKLYDICFANAYRRK